MCIQMGYGVYTNSLGLVSDSIHMLVDCAAIAFGLAASVLADEAPETAVKTVLEVMIVTTRSRSQAFSRHPHSHDPTHSHARSRSRFMTTSRSRPQPHSHSRTLTRQNLPGNGLN